jgi:cyclase
MKISRIVSALSLLLGILGLTAQQDFSSVQIKTTHVSKNVYMLEGSGGNIGVSAGPDGLLIVDDQFAPLAEKIGAALKQINPGKLKFILNTHYHGDHTGGNPHFGKEAPIIAHSNVRKRLLPSSAGKESGLPVVTFDDHLSVHFNGEEIKLFHVPHGHTDGDTIIQFTDANVIHMGDQFFSGRFPNIDLNSGGDVKGFTQNLETVLKKLPDGAKVIPGHGPLSGAKEMQEALTMLKETTAIVQKEIDEGKSLEQIKSTGLPEKWKSWAVPTLSTSRWLEIVYTSLTRKKP